MASSYGADRKLSCVVCGLKYDSFRIGNSFLLLRQEIIALGVDKNGKRKYGRRSGVLGLMHQRKKMAWRLHVDECIDGLENAESAAAFMAMAIAAREKYEASELEILRARRALASKKHTEKLKQLGLKRIGPKGIHVQEVAKERGRPTSRRREVQSQPGSIADGLPVRRPRVRERRRAG